MKARIVQTRIWQDTFFRGLNNQARLLFMWCLTNGRIETTGAYEVDLESIAYETKLTADEVEQALKDVYPKIQYVDNYVVVLNATKYQNFVDKGSEKQRLGFLRELQLLPASVSEVVVNHLETSYKLVINGFETSSNSNSNSKRNIGETSYKLVKNVDKSGGEKRFDQMPEDS